MRFPDYSVAVDVARVSPASVDVDVLVLPTCEGEVPALDLAVSDSTAQRLADVVLSREFTGEPYSLCLVPIDGDAWRPRRLLLVGLGPRSALTSDKLRRAATAAALDAKSRKARRLGVLLPGLLPVGDEARTIVEGVTLAVYHTGAYKTDPESIPAAFDAFVLCPVQPSETNSDAIGAAARKGLVLGACTNLARALANEPGNAMTPAAFADVAVDIARESGLAVEVLDEGQLESLNMGLLLGVAQGSAARPRVVVLRYEPAHARENVLLGLVGKGVTFDAGGISIKPSDGMHKMKDDMSGGAAVVAAMKAIAALEPDVRVVGVVPLVENMPGGRALKPGDVLKSAAGTTVEVLDTDAEGRLILGDALWYARRLGATHLVDVATLTGAIGVALGRSTSGLFGTPDSWTDLVRRVSTEAGDRMWPMPLFDDYREQLRSDIADLANVGGRQAGAITAAVFLKEFAGGLPWAHLDIAGTAWADEAQPFQPKGPTGVAVRTLVALAEAAGTWPTK